MLVKHKDTTLVLNWGHGKWILEWPLLRVYDFNSDSHGSSSCVPCVLIILNHVNTEKSTQQKPGLSQGGETENYSLRDTSKEEPLCSPLPIPKL